MWLLGSRRIRTRERNIYLSVCVTEEYTIHIPHLFSVGNRIGDKQLRVFRETETQCIWGLRINGHCKLIASCYPNLTALNTPFTEGYWWLKIPSHRLLGTVTHPWPADRRWRRPGGPLWRAAPGAAAARPGHRCGRRASSELGWCMRICGRIQNSPWFNNPYKNKLVCTIHFAKFGLNIYR